MGGIRLGCVNGVWKARPMDSAVVVRAIAATEAEARSLGLLVDATQVAHNSNKLSLRLHPCAVFARVAHVGQHVAAFELDVAQQLLANGAPVAVPDERVAPQVHVRDGFAITWWTLYDAAPSQDLQASSYADALKHLHTGMSHVEVAAPHFLDRVGEAEHLVANHELTPRLSAIDRTLLSDIYDRARRTIDRVGAAEQLLHGEPHPGNVLNTPAGPVFVDLETCCFGPVEFDVAHAPVAVAQNYPGLDVELLDVCRQLVLAMVAAWRWDINDAFPDGMRYGHLMLDVLRDGPPWPTIGELPASS
jgi:Ser/Thr protein kinase RdoA (MazF antagonist)